MVPTLDGRPALSDVSAHVDASVIFIPSTPFRSLIEQEPSLLVRITGELCRNIRGFGIHIERLAMLPLRERIADVLLSLATTYGRFTDGGLVIELKLSQDDLAAMLSVSRQRINTELRSLNAEGVIATRYNQTIILDKARLATYSALVAP